ncbi:lactonase family protein [Sphingomonas sp. G-3-2-10]|uniref:lactonase family protein n=1 Tax=Sphingomonas sp. G-3-2-10 TaxID=2728838 RepID=UPI00146ACB0A|nr:lactonase family protein [Sphingomonas sp. G-3-2-10]NML08264.1 lactonase family protein [Sphingomonas sp. G-3-2-10]
MTDRQSRFPRRTISACLALAASAVVLGPLPATAQQAAPCTEECGDQLVYIGTQASDPGQGIFAARLDSRTGKLTPIGMVAEIRRPTWLVARTDKPILYAVSEVGNDSGSGGEVLTLIADRKTGQLRIAGRIGSGGANPTHLALDPNSRTVAAAHYASGHVAALPILADETLGVPATQKNEGSGPHRRQQSPHAHGVAFDPGHRFLLAADLGADKLFVYRYDAAKRALTPADPVSVGVTPGTGPRHLAFHPGGKLLFLITEIVPEIRTYRWDARAGRLTLAQSLVIPFDEATRAITNGAELLPSEDGKFLYASLRGEDLIIAYAVDRNSGKLTELQRIPAGGQKPWSFAIAPNGRWLIVANQASNVVTVLARDPRTGKLTATGNSIDVPKPVNVTFLR